jgi:hypothetical protein
MRWWFLVACSCSGDGGGTFDATVDDNGASSTFSQSCELTASDEFFDISSTGDSLGFEIKWKRAAISAPGTYSSAGIVSDLVLFTLRGDDIDTASGSVTFTVYEAPDAFAGTFELAVEDTFTAAGSFDCH